MSTRSASAPRPPPPVRGCSPVRYLAQHGAGIEAPRIDGEHFRPAWRRRSRIDKLLAKGSIGFAEYLAAQRYRSTHEIAFGSILKSRGIPDGAGARPGRGTGRATRLAPSERQVDAVARLDRVAGELGTVAVQLIELVVIADECWSKIAARLRCDPKTARKWTLLSLQALAQRGEG
jgi:hypothetical protein